MVPADNPQFIISIMVDNPSNGAEGGDVAAPLFHDLASYELQHADIAPTGAQAKHVPLQICDSHTLFYSPSTVC
jgi:cell division protein FtsI (penicillin-binding protein 3)